VPRAYDQRQLVVDRNPLQQLPVDYGKLPKLDPIDPADLVHTYLSSLERITGIDLSGIEQFLDSIKDAVGLALKGFGTIWNNFIGGVTRVWTGITDTAEKIWSDAVDAIQNIFGTGKNAALSADHANIGVQALKAQLAGGGSDEFNYADANALPSAYYAVSYGGPGGGYYGPNGEGYLVWKPSGAQVREIIYRRTDTTLGSDNFVVTVVWSERPRDPIFADTFGYICGRMSNISNSTHVRASIDNNAARIQAVVSGTATQIGSTKSLTIRNGDVFELYGGHPDHPRRFWLKQNGTTVLTVEDGAANGSGSISQMGSNYRQNGFGCRVDNYLVLFQNPAPSLAGWTWAPQTEVG
jgi:hypothetical protein